MEGASVPLSTTLWFVVPPLIILAASFLLSYRRKGE